MPTTDGEILAVAAEIQALDRHGTLTAQVLRKTYDQLYDGQHTARYRWDQLFKTEKTHCGTLVEINLQREFKFIDGVLLDYRIANAEVDCKFSQTLGGWMIPPEATGHICLLLWAEDTVTPTWSMGLVRASVDHLNAGRNRDGKLTLNQTGRNAIVWLFRNDPLPPNVLLQLDRQTVDRILAQPSGQARVNELFRSAQRRLIGRGAVATVAQQDDYMKRVRANGGARTALQREGIIILGQYSSHSAIARALGVPIPGPGDSVSVHVAPAAAPGSGVVEIRGTLWRIAQATDRVVPAPKLPII